MAQKDDDFKVVDKRRFTSDADRSFSSAPTGNLFPGATADSKIATDDGGAELDSTSKINSASEYSPVDFSSFLMGYWHQVMVLLGNIPHPQTGSVAVDFNGARETIDLLALLEEKTSGNLTEDEGRMLTEMLAVARLSYVEKMKR